MLAKDLYFKGTINDQSLYFAKKNTISIYQLTDPNAEKTFNRL